MMDHPMTSIIAVILALVWTVYGTIGGVALLASMQSHAALLLVPILLVVVAVPPALLLARFGPSV